MKKLFSGISKRWNNYLARLSKVNNDPYGNKRLDCCDLSHDQVPKHESGK